MFAAKFCRFFVTIFLIKKGSWLEFVVFFFSFPDSCPGSKCNSGCSVTNISNPRIIACTCTGKTRRVPRLLPIVATYEMVSVFGFFSSLIFFSFFFFLIHNGCEIIMPEICGRSLPITVT